MSATIDLAALEAAVERFKQIQVSEESKNCMGKPGFEEAAELLWAVLPLVDPPSLLRPAQEVAEVLARLALQPRRQTQEIAIAQLFLNGRHDFPVRMSEPDGCETCHEVKPRPAFVIVDPRAMPTGQRDRVAAAQWAAASWRF